MGGPSTWRIRLRLNGQGKEGIEVSAGGNTRSKDKWEDFQTSYDVDIGKGECAKSGREDVRESRQVGRGSRSALIFDVVRSSP